MKRGFLSGLLASIASFSALAPSVALAGGYDTPVLYSARHMGMGGAAIAYVNDPSAMFHNPSGLANVEKASVMANVSPLIGKIRATPIGKELDSETTFAPFFLLGGAYRINDMFTVGMAVYPVASAGAEYKFDVAGMPAETTTSLVFIEASPGVAVNIIEGLSIGAGYRITYATLDRFQGLKSNPALDFELSGINFLGFRLGAQYDTELGDGRMRAGVVYRHRTDTDLKADDGIAGSMKFTDVSMKFTLPSRLGFGVRYDLLDFGIALDAEYAFNSQNKGYPLKGTDPGGMDREVANYFKWDNAWTFRPGVEYRLMEGQLPVRVGYIFDQKTSNEKFPSAFGTPPGPSHVGTVGAGWIGDNWQVNAAYAYRTAQGKVTMDDIAEGMDEVDPDCAFCSGAGDYELTMHGIYLDGSYNF